MSTNPCCDRLRPALHPTRGRLAALGLLAAALAACGGSGSTDGGSSGPAGSAGGLRNPVTVTDTVQFATQGQGLFGPGQAVTNQTFEPIWLERKEVGPGTQGGIHHVRHDVPLEMLQNAWDKAMATCTAYGYTIQPVPFCGPYTFSPNQAQCETGTAHLTRITLPCCWWGATVDVLSTWPGCSPIGGFHGSTTVDVPAGHQDYDVGAAVGPRPTRPAPRDFDVGAVASYHVKTNVGLEFSVTSDAGSVDAGYASRASLTADAREVAPGQAFHLRARHEPIAEPARTYLRSRYPSMDFAFRYFLDLLAKLDVEYAMLDPDGVQQHTVTHVLDFSTASDPQADAQGRLVGNLVGVNLGLGGAEVRIFPDQDWLPADFPHGVTFDFPIPVAYDVTFPFTCPKAGTPKGGAWTCSPVSVSTDLMELGVWTPDVNTPAGPRYDGGVTDFGTLTPLLPVSNALQPDGTVLSTTPVGFRPVLDSSFLAALGNLRDLVLDDGRLSTDFARVDLDIDGLTSLLYAGQNVLGRNVDLGLTLWPTGRSVALASIEANALDMDFANWFSLDQALTLQPNLAVRLAFSQPVQVREPGAGSFTTVSELTLPVPVGGDATLEVLQPAGGVTVTPTWSLAGNVFNNDTRFVWTPALQATYLQFKFGGVLLDILAAAAIQESLNFAALQDTLAAPPVEIGTLATTPYSLAGFQDVAGTPLRVASPP